MVPSFWCETEELRGIMKVRFNAAIKGEEKKGKEKS